MGGLVALLSLFLIISATFAAWVPQKVAHVPLGADTLRAYNIVRPTRLSVLGTLPAQDEVDDHYQFEVLGHSFRLKLKRNALLTAGYQEILMDREGNIVSTRPREEIQDGCYYHGQVEGDPDSLVSLSTCPEDVGLDESELRVKSGSQPIRLRGFISAFGEQLSIEPLKLRAGHLATAEAHPDEHLVYRQSDLPAESMACGVGANGHNMQAQFSATSNDEAHQEPGHAHASAADTMHLHSIGGATVSASSRMKTQANGATEKYVELVVFNDYKRYLAKGANALSDTRQIINSVAALYATAPTAVGFNYKVYVKLTAQIVFGSGDPYAAPTADCNPGEVNTEDLLKKFTAYHKTAIANLPAHDNAYLFTHYDLCAGTMGLAWVGTMCCLTNCGDSGSTGLVQTTAIEPTRSAAVAAHEMGHNFGANHDDKYHDPSLPASFVADNCNDVPNRMSRIMVAVSGNEIPTKWSACTHTWVNSWFDNIDMGDTREYGIVPSTATCLEDVATDLWQPDTNKCGNGVREDGEDCDCGPSSCATVDPCCDQSTCKLKPGKTCSRYDKCCDATCNVVTDTNQVCRASEGECDLEEKCNGGSAACPTDTYKTPGTTCNAGTAFGSARTGTCFEKSCLSHWTQCVGIDLGAGQPVVISVCATANDAGDTCEKLWCQHQGVSTCYSYYGPLLIDNGTPCGSGKQCYNNQCVQSTAMPQPPIDAYWSAAPWDPCSQNCGGVQERTVTCIFEGAAAHESKCSTLPKPAVKQGCDTLTCPYRWNSTMWTECSVTCGTGIQTRENICTKKSDGAMTSVSNCGTNTIPATSQSCTLAACAGEPGSTPSSTGGAGSDSASTEVKKVFKIEFLDKEPIKGVKIGYILIAGVVLVILLCCCCWVQCCSREKRAAKYAARNGARNNGPPSTAGRDPNKAVELEFSPI